MRRPSGRDAGILLAGVLVSIVLLVVALNTGTTRHQSAATVPAPPVVIGHAGTPPASAATLSAVELATARATALAFVRSYLPVLYGQAPVGRIVDASAHLRRSLRSAPRPPRTVRTRHPRLRGLELTAQSNRSVLATASVDDGVAAPFAVVFTVEQQGGRWVVSDLASD